MSNFNPDDFMNVETTVTNETEYTPIPEGDYQGVISDLKSDVSPNGSPMLNITWLVDDESVRKFTGMAEPTVRQTIWLDVNDNGSLASGANKNVGLGRLRAALGQNDGKPWSPSMLRGGVALIKIGHTPSKKEPGVLYSNVVQVAKL